MNDTGVYQCNKCCLPYNCMANLQRHFVQCHPFSCVFCGATIFGKEEIAFHISTTHPGYYVCKICLDLFIEESDFTSHKAMHAELTCDVCTRVLSCKLGLFKHYRYFHKLYCELCKKECQNQADFLSHFKSDHTDLHICETCLIYYKDKLHFEKHLLKHSEN